MKLLFYDSDWIPLICGNNVLILCEHIEVCYAVYLYVHEAYLASTTAVWSYPVYRSSFNMYIAGIYLCHNTSKYIFNPPVTSSKALNVLYRLCHHTEI